MLNICFVNVGANLRAQAGTGNLKASFNNKMPSNMYSSFFQQVVPEEVYQIIQNQKKQLAPKIFPSNFTKLLVNG